MNASSKSGKGKKVMSERKLKATGDFKVKVIRSRPTKDDMLLNISVPVTPERLAKAVLKGGAPRRESLKK